MAEDTRAEDELAVRNLVAALARAADVGTLEEYAAVFTDDAASELAGYPPTNGLEALMEGAAARRQTGGFGPGSGTMHFLGAIHVEMDGDEATSYTPFVLYQQTESSPTPATAGRYYDTFRRTAQGWRIAGRRAVIG
jgi:ketosteroid isomerase-like protein